MIILENFDDARTDFTRANYSRLLQKVSSTHKIGTVSQFKNSAITAIWRHDVDCSPQSALVFGKIEKELGVQATYYFNMRSDFYNLFESAVADIVSQLHAMGHEVGLHFDAALSDVSDVKLLKESLEKEKTIFQNIFKFELKSFSFHNPSEATQKYSLSI